MWGLGRREGGSRRDGAGKRRIQEGQGWAYFWGGGGHRGSVAGNGNRTTPVHRSDQARDHRTDTVGNRESAPFPETETGPLQTPNLVRTSTTVWARDAGSGQMPGGEGSGEDVAPAGDGVGVRQG